MKSTLLYLFLFSACMSRVKNKVPILPQEVSIGYLEPYCGGAKPLVNQKNNFIPITMDSFFIEKRNSDGQFYFKNLKSVNTDENGRFIHKMGSGFFALYNKKKVRSFSEFYSMEIKDDRFFKSEGEDCYRKWWRTPDNIFEIKDTSQSIRITLHKQCYVNFNPCIEYIGPPNR